MRKILWCTLILIGFLNIGAVEISDYPFSHTLTNEEELLMETWERDFTPTDPPVGPIRQIAEFEQMYGVLIAYSGGFGIPYSAIAEISEVAKVLTIVANTYQQTTVTNLYTSYGVNLDNCEFVIAPTNSYWTRDYGPWFIIDGNDEFGVVDFPYNRPRPYDDEIPVVIADYLDINLFGMEIEHTGGNYMCDGLGIGSSTTLVWQENPGLSHNDIDQLILEFCGIESYHVLPDPLGDYIEHIDCWGKFLDVDKVLIGQVLQSDPRYEDYEYVANFFAEQTSSYGTPYEVYRVFTPGGFNYPTPYTNSFICNNKVFVPVAGSTNDSAALAVYQEAMPGYDVIGVMSGNWYDTDAFHCRVHEIADKNMLYVEHVPVSGEVEAEQDIEILAEIIAYSGEDLYEDSLLIHYRINDDQYETLIMTAVTARQNTYHAFIPAQTDSCVVSYYLSAADMSGRSVFHPFIGEPDPHVFTIIPENQVDPNPVCASDPVPADGSADILIYTEIGWSYYHDPDYTEPAGFRIYMAYDEDLTDAFTTYIDYNGEGEYLMPHPFDFTYDTQYFWQVIPTTENSRGDAVDCQVWSFTTEPGNGSGTGEIMPLATRLNKNYPNPFNPETTISFSIKNGEEGWLTIINLKGQVLERKRFTSGEHTYIWNADDYDSGIYFSKLSSPSFKGINKMILMK